MPLYGIFLEFLVNKKISGVLISIFIAFVAFMVIVGFNVLDPSNIIWLQDEDQWQIYLSPIFFSQHLWLSIVGLNPLYGLDISSSIAFNASVLAIAHKLLSYFFNIHNQYLGFWLLACFIFQGIFSWKILSIYTQNYYLRIFGCVMFLFSPPMLARLDIHILLVSHFLILWAIYLTLDNKHKSWPQLSWLAVLTISATIHFYIFFLVGAMWVANILDSIFRLKLLSIRRGLAIFFTTILVVLLIAWQMGYFTISSSSVGEFGFGFYRSHLLTFIDSSGWSYFIPSMKTSSLRFGDFLLYEGTYEGFAFMGLGGIALGCFAILGALNFEDAVRTQINRNFFRGKTFFWVVLIFFIILAISSNVTILKWNIHISLPSSVEHILGIYRASGRAIWPVFYIILTYFIYLNINFYSNKKSILILGASCILQVADTSAGWIPIANNFRVVQSQSSSNAVKHHFWSHISNRYNSIRIEPLNAALKQPHWLTFSRLASAKGMGTNAIYQGRVDANKVALSNYKFDLAMSTGQYDPQALYIIDDDLVIPVSKTLNRKHDLFAKIDGFNVLAPGWLACDSCPPVSSDLLIHTPELPLPKLDTPFTFGKGGSGIPYLLGVGQVERVGWGWAYPESWGTWSEGRQGKLFIPYPNDVKPASAIFTVKALIGNMHPLQRVEIWVNGQMQKTVTLDKFDGNVIEIALPKETARNFCLIEFRLPDAVSAKELGIGSDVRKLAIGLEGGVLK